MKTTEKLIKDFERFNDELNAFGEETGEIFVTLYENANTTRRVERHSFKLYKNGKLTWVEYDEFKGISQTEEYIHMDDDDIKDTLKFWKANLRRAKKYWSMNTETLDKIQDGEIEDTTDSEEA